jgi:hypothetical protein
VRRLAASGRWLAVKRKDWSHDGETLRLRLRNRLAPLDLAMISIRWRERFVQVRGHTHGH